ncbi:MAG: Hsp20/alpha crystallin family protein [Bacteroidota bacterium]
MSLIKRTLPNWSAVSDFFDDDWTRDWFMKGNGTPAVNVVDNETSYEIELAAPGYKKKDFKVQVENGILTVSGETEKKEEEKKKNYTRQEFYSTSFSRSFTLPDDVIKEDVDAKYSDGVLHLILKKTKKKLPERKEIMIK